MQPLTTDNLIIYFAIGFILYILILFAEKSLKTAVNTSKTLGKGVKFGIDLTKETGKRARSYGINIIIGTIMSALIFLYLYNSGFFA